MADTTNDNIQHGIDDDPHDDGKKGLELGALGGGTVGAIAGMAAGPIGAVIGAIVGGTAGSIASGAAVDAVDSIDNDNTVTGIGGTDTTGTASGDVTRMSGMHESGVTADRLHTPGNDVPGVQTGGVTTAGADTRGIMEKTADALTGDNVDDKTGGRVMDTDATMTTGMTGAAAMGTATTGAMGTAMNTGTQKVELLAEELQVNKTMQQAGEVEIHKEIIEEQVNVPVTVQREEVVITRHAVDRDLAPGEIAGNMDEGEVIRVPVMEEQVNVSKTAHVVEEVEVAKRTVTDDQTVTGTVRHEEIDVNDTTKRM